MKTAKAKPPGVEEWAAKVVAAELGMPVEVHDDGSQQSMYDLRVGPPGARRKRAGENRVHRGAQV